VKPVGEPLIGSPVLTAVGLAVGILISLGDTFPAAKALSTA